MTTLSTQTYTHLKLSGPNLLLRLEGLTVLIGAAALYGYQGYSWWAFALLLLAPDLAMIGYAVNIRLGSLTYNLFHTYSLPVGLAVIGLIAGWSIGLQLALIWLAHIGMDRTVGYGLKYATHFKDTHLSRV